MVELMTYRLGGHSTSDDPRAYRSEEELASWQKVDPIVRAREYLLGKAWWSDDEEEALRQQIEAELKVCIEQAEATAKPPLATMFEQVYKDQPDHLREQQGECESGPRARDVH